MSIIFTYMFSSLSLSLNTFSSSLLLHLLSHQASTLCHKLTSTAMNEHYKEDKPYCHFHPKEETIGVCPLCLNERLLILAADQALSLRPEFSLSNKQKKKPPITLPKIFALGSLLHRFEFQHNKAEESHDCQSDASAASLEGRVLEYFSLSYGYMMSHEYMQCLCIVYTIHM